MLSHVAAAAVFLAGVSACTGSDPAGPRCTGEAQACIVRTQANCAAQAGCSYGQVCFGNATPCVDYQRSEVCSPQAGCEWVPGCLGVARLCSDYFTEGQCRLQRGCVWNNTGLSCTGVSDECISFDAATCQDQEGCFTGHSCRGTATLCNGIPLASCTTQEGCVVTDGCGGAAQSCADLTAEPACQAQTGCAWAP